jgi:hypothetical protein
MSFLTGGRVDFRVGELVRDQPGRPAIVTVSRPSALARLQRYVRRSLRQVCFADDQCVDSHTSLALTIHTVVLCTTQVQERPSGWNVQRGRWRTPDGILGTPEAARGHISVLVRRPLHHVLVSPRGR